MNCCTLARDELIYIYDGTKDALKSKEISDKICYDVHTHSTTLTLTYMDTSVSM